MEHIDLVLAHWPFFCTAALLAALGRIGDRVFTRERAYTFTDGVKRAKRQPWFWLRETMPAHPILGGLCIGLVMPDPEGLGWSRGLIVLYFAGAGVCGLAGWIYMRAKRKTICLPGESLPPEA